MTKAMILLVFLAVIVTIVCSTKVNECGSGKSLGDKVQVQITNCDAPPCKLKKRTKVSIVQKFKPDHDVKNLKTSVQATILGVPFPFIGVDGASACGKIFSATDGKPSPCPLKKDVEYIYKNEFPILAVYPTVSLTVHWALQENNKPITCFEVPSRIV